MDRRKLLAEITGLIIIIRAAATAADLFVCCTGSFAKQISNYANSLIINA